MHEPARVLPHGCPARVCEYPGCRVTELHDRMVQADDGAWFCPRHGLLNAAKVLLTLYRAPGDADWSQICELIAETLPGVLAVETVPPTTAESIQANPFGLYVTEIRWTKQL